MTVREDVKEEDLIDEYQNYLNQKMMQRLEFDEDKEEYKDTQNNFSYELDHFDYNNQKVMMRELFN